VRLSFPVIASFALVSVAPVAVPTPASAEPGPSPAAVLCDGFSAGSLDAPSLSAPIEVVSVEPIHRRIGRVQTGTIVGARISIVADPGLSPSGVERLIRCRAARDSASDVLAVDGATISIHPTSTGYLVEARGRRSEAGGEIWSRASLLTTR